MLRFHVCHSGHDCDNNKLKNNLVDIGTRFVFAKNQFSQSMAETLTVRVLPTAV